MAAWTAAEYIAAIAVLEAKIQEYSQLPDQADLGRSYSFSASINAMNATIARYRREMQELDGPIDLEVRGCT